MQQHGGNPRIEKLLVERGTLSQADLKRLRRHPAFPQDLAHALESMGLMTEEQLLDLVAEVSGAERLSLQGVSPDWAMAETLSFDLCARHCAVPLRLEGRTAVVAMRDPGDLSAVDELRFRLGTRVRPVLAREGEILSAIQQCFPEDVARRSAKTDAVIHEARTRGLEPVSDLGLAAEAAARQNYLAWIQQGETGGEGASLLELPLAQLAAVRLVHELLTMAAVEGATHLRLELFPDEVMLRFRRAGAWDAPRPLPGSLSMWVVWHVKTLCGCALGPLTRPAVIPLPHAEVGGALIWIRMFLLPVADGHLILGAPVGASVDFSTEILWEPETPALRVWWQRLQAGAEAFAAGQMDHAEDELIAAAELADEQGAEGRVPLAESLSTLARVVAAAGRDDDARALHGRALAVREVAQGETSPHLVSTLLELGDVLVRLGIQADAMAQLRRALELVLGAYGGEDLEAAWILERMGRIAASQGRTHEAMECLERADALSERLLEGVRHPFSMLCQGEQGEK